MSPEQACGKPVDRRTDIWAFGVVFFEMLTGRGPFTSDSTSETLASVLKTEPDWSALPTTLPPDLRRLLGRCLVKDSRRRVQSIGDVRAQIDDLLNSPASDSAGRSVGPGRRRWLTAAGVGIVTLSLVGAVVAWLTRNGTSGAMIDDLFSGGIVRPITEFEGANLDASISPDGNFVTFLADRGGAFHVWLKRIGAGTATDLTPGQADQRNPGPQRSAGFSGDGSEIWINGSRAAGRRLQLVPLLGGTPSVFLGERAVNVAWSPDGTRLVYNTSEGGDPLYVADADGGNAQQLYRGTEGDHNHFPAWSTDSRWIYFTCAVQSVSEFAVCRVPSSGQTNQAARLTSSTNDVRYLTPLDPRTVLFVAPDQDRSGPWLWAFDVERQTVHRVSSGLDLERYLSVASSVDGRRLVVTIAKSSASLWSVPLLDRISGEGDVTAYSAAGLRSSAPRFVGTTLFYLAPSRAGDGLWKRQGDGPPAEVWKGSDGALLEAPSVSSSGDRVAVVIRKQARLHITIVRTDGADHRTLAEGIDVRGTSAWSPDSEWIVTGGSDAQGPGLFKIKVADGAYDRLRTGPAFNPVWSPDGTTIVYEGQQSAVAPLIAVHPDGSDVENFPVISVPSGGQGRSRFLSNGHLVYLAGPAGTQDFVELDLATFKSRLISHLQSPSVVNAFDITPDGRHIVFDRLREQSEIRLIDLPRK
jgi:Tol biopolymer transport system component